MATDVGVPIAVTGLSCRFPNDADSPSNFWKFLCDARNSVSEDSSRWNTDAFHARSKKLNTSITRRAHYLKQDIAAWDAGFFNISKAEAESIDPQQRIFLEVVYEALENAGQPIHEIAGSRTGVFVGSFTSDYRELIHRDPELAPSYTLTGTSNTSTSNRVSWFFDLKGPSFTLNTACSSSLVALHLACQSLRTGESDSAIVGGVNLLLNPDIFMYLSNQGFLAKDGRCKSFDAAGDGYGRGDGFAAIILRRADDAVKSVDHIRAVIRGTGCNQDGKTRGFTLPSADAQAILTEETYRNAGLEYSDTHYVEAHGTGTQAGDSEETLGLAKTIATSRSPLQPLLIGSVKSNIGHLEGCAGLAGFIKAIFILEKGVIPPTYGLENLNPKVKWSEWNLEVPTELTPWPTGGLRRISIQGFGYGGTNAHIIVDDAVSYLISKGISREPHEEQMNDDSIEPSPKLYMITSQDREGLQRVRKSLAQHLENVEKESYASHDDEQHYLHDLAYTLALKRSRLQWTTFAVASSSANLSRKLINAQNTFESRRIGYAPRIGFIFTGQGAQWPRMGHDLMIFPPYRASIKAADKYLRNILRSKWSVEHELAREDGESLIHGAEHSQALCTILQVALVDLLNSWNILSSAVIGHSSGEIAAAYCAGGISREDAWKIAFFRGVHCGQLNDVDTNLRGAMMVVSAPLIDISEAILKVSKGEVSIACFNSPSSITVAGDEAGIDQLAVILDDLGINARKLRVDRAYHSSHMQAIAHHYMESISDIDASNTTSACKMYSSTFSGIATSRNFGPAAWVRNLTSPVYFSEAVSNMLQPNNISAGATKSAVDILVEIGPHEALKGSVMQIMNAQHIKGIEYFTALKRNTDCVETILSCAGSLFAMGVPVDLKAANQLQSGRIEPLADLPAYPWNHSHSFWHESRLNKEYRLREHPQSSLLGAPHPSLGEDEWIWRGFLRTDDEPWICDHMIQGEVLYPAAGFFVMAIEAANQLADATKTVKSFNLRDITINAALIVSTDQNPEVIVQLRPHLTGTRGSSYDWLEFTVSSSTDSSTIRKNCSGLIRIDYGPAHESLMAEEMRTEASKAVSTYQELQNSCTTTKNHEEFYIALSKLGLQYGVEFAKLSDIGYGFGTSSAKLNVALPASKLGPEVGRRPHVIHPATLDASFHLAFAALLDERGSLKGAMVPTRIENLTIAATIACDKDAVLKGCAYTAKNGLREIVSNITVLNDEMTEPQILVEGMFLTDVSGAGKINTETSQKAKLCYDITWRPILQTISSPDLENYFSESLQRAADSHNAENSNELSEFIISYLQLLQHIFTREGGLSILEAEVGHQESIKPLLIPQSQSFGNSTRSFHYTALVSNQSRQEWLRETSSPGCTDALVSSILSQDVNEVLPVRRFDLIVLVHSTGLSKDEISRSFDFATQALSPGGRIILLSNSDASTLTPVINTRELEIEYQSHQAEEVQRIVLCVKKDNHLANPPTELVILEAQNPSIGAANIANDLSIIFNDHEIHVQRLKWPADPAKLRGKACISLVELSEPLLENISELDFEILQALLLNNTDLTWVSHDNPSGALMSGLARSIRNEVANAQLRTIMLDSESIEASASILFKYLTSSCEDNEVRALHGVLNSARVEENSWLSEQVDESNSEAAKSLTRSKLKDLPRPAKLSIQHPGILESICMEPDLSVQEPLREREVEIDVKATGMNFREVMAVLGQIPDNKLGFDCAGIVRKLGPNTTKFSIGDRIAMYAHGSHRTVHRAPAAYCELIPDGITLEEAATIPLVHGTAWYGITRLAKAERGQSILIHAAAGGVGQSAIMLAQHLGLIIYVTVGSEEKRQFVRSTYGIPDSHIFNSRDLSFAKGIKRMTEGRGVDIVLNSLSGEALRQSWHCLAAFGTFLEIGLKDILNNSRLDMAPFRNDAVFAFYNLNHIETARPRLMEEIIHNVFALIRRGVLRPVSPLKVYPISEVESAFRLMQMGKHIGKVALTWSADDTVQCTGFTRNQTELNPNGVYVLVGGLGGIGRSLALMLMKLGAKKICFLSRSGATSRPAQELLQKMHDSGVQAEAYRCDIGDPNETRLAVQRCQEELGPIRGIIQGAMSLQDVLFANMTHTQWVDSLRPKVQGTRNLHHALPSDLDFFVILSSFAGIFGNRGQGNYAAAGAYQDAIAHYRRSQSLKAISIDLGIIRDVGVLAETGSTDGLRQWEEAFGIRETELHRLVQMAIQGQSELDHKYPAQISTGFATAGEFDRVGLETPYYFNEPRFSILASTRNNINTGDAATSAKQELSLISQLSLTPSLEDATQIIADAIVARLAKTLQTTASEIDQARPVHSYGVDSLVAVELSQWIFKEFQAAITVFDLLASMPITSLALKITEKSTAVPMELK